MSENDHSTREHIHNQKYQFRFHSETLSPLKGGSGKPRFSVEPQVYVSGVGWEIIDPLAKGNQFMIGFRNYVRLKEFMGYEHTGKSSDEITTTLNNLWGMNIDE